MIMLVEFLNALGLTKSALDVVGKVKELLPDSPEKEAAAKSLEQAEKAILIAEVSAAKELGYLLCQCTWPPQIALRKPDGSQRCPACNYNLLDDYRGHPGGGY